MGRTSTIYLLHFTPPYRVPIGETGRVKEAGHYMGSTSAPVAERLATHMAGRGSPLVRAAIGAGCTITLAASWPGDRLEERRLKRHRHHARRCPICKEGAESS